MGIRLLEVGYRLPAAADAYFRRFTSLLAGASGVTSVADGIRLTPAYPSGALPLTSLRLADCAGPEIVFSPGPAIDLTLGALRLRGTGADSGPRAVGEGEAPPPDTLPLDEVVRRLRGHVIGVDHTGVNVPAASLSRPEWDRLLDGLADVANLYRYPTGEDWPFVIPADRAEFAADIRDFAAAREPKFELVYDVWVSRPLWQFALRTDLTRPELEALLPAPYGSVLEGLADFFRVVRVPPPCPGLDIRLDLYYRDEGTGNGWASGAWLITEGGRMRSLRDRAHVALE